MAAALVSQPDRCADCSQPLTGTLSPHLCAQCGQPQPVQPSEDFFLTLGAPRRFSQDLGQLERRFYELSRALHPDRFPGKNAVSLERMSHLNRAYSTLKNRAELRSYLLELEGVKVGSQNQIPMELAESWFELQDTLMEDPEAARTKLQEFEKEMFRFKQVEETALMTLEKSYDQSFAREDLEKIARHIQAQSYLKSLDRDIGRIREKVFGHGHSDHK